MIKMIVLLFIAFFLGTLFGFMVSSLMVAARSWNDEGDE